MQPIDRPHESSSNASKQCLGNHDYMGRAEAQIERTDRDSSGRWHMPSRSYSRIFSQGVGRLLQLKAFDVQYHLCSSRRADYRTAKLIEGITPETAAPYFFFRKPRRVASNAQPSHARMLRKNHVVRAGMSCCIFRQEMNG